MKISSFMDSTLATIHFLHKNHFSITTSFCMDDWCMLKNIDKEKL